MRWAAITPPGNWSWARSRPPASSALRSSSWVRPPAFTTSSRPRAGARGGAAHPARPRHPGGRRRQRRLSAQAPPAVRHHGQRVRELGARQPPGAHRDHEQRRRGDEGQRAGDPGRRAPAGLRGELHWKRGGARLLRRRRGCGRLRWVRGEPAPEIRRGAGARDLYPAPRGAQPRPVRPAGRAAGDPAPAGAGPPDGLHGARRGSAARRERDLHHHPRQLEGQSDPQFHRAGRRVGPRPDGGYHPRRYRTALPPASPRVSGRRPPGAGGRRDGRKGRAPPLAGDSRRRVRPRRTAVLVDSAPRRVVPRTIGVGSTIAGLGCYLPERVLTNVELAKTVDTTDEWIQRRTGVRERRIAAASEATSDLAYKAARESLRAAGVAATDLDFIVVGTTTPD